MRPSSAGPCASASAPKPAGPATSTSPASLRTACILRPIGYTRAMPRGVILGLMLAALVPVANVQVSTQRPIDGLDGHKVNEGKRSRPSGARATRDGLLTAAIFGTPKLGRIFQSS